MFIKSKSDLTAAVNEIGILPYFTNRVRGWSIEENIDREIWFTDNPGPWEWKGELACARECVYGKFIHGKAAFVSIEAFADLANLRRDGLTFDESVDEGLISMRERQIIDYFTVHTDELSKYAKRECGVSKGYDTALTRLMMRTYLIYSDFRYSIDRCGRPYGWGNGALSTPEAWLGGDFMAAAEDRSSEESLSRLTARIRAVMPDLDEAALAAELIKV